MIFLETERLVLRNVSAKDAQIMYDYRNHERCAKYQRGQTKDLPGIQALIEKRQHDIITDSQNFMVAVALRDTDETIGEIVVMPNDGAITLGYPFLISTTEGDMPMRPCLRSPNFYIPVIQIWNLSVSQILRTSQVWRFCESLVIVTWGMLKRSLLKYLANGLPPAFNIMNPRRFLRGFLHRSKEGFI